MISGIIANARIIIGPSTMRQNRLNASPLSLLPRSRRARKSCWRRLRSHWARLTCALSSCPVRRWTGDVPQRALRDDHAECVGSLRPLQPLHPMFPGGATLRRCFLNSPTVQQRERRAPVVAASSTFASCDPAGWMSNTRIWHRPGRSPRGSRRPAGRSPRAARPPGRSLRGTRRRAESAPSKRTPRWNVASTNQAPRWKVAPEKSALHWKIALSNRALVRMAWPWSSCGAAASRRSRSSLLITKTKGNSDCRP
jgi:hypothetical protein